MEDQTSNEYLFTGCTCKSCAALQQSELQDARDRWIAGEREILFRPYHYTCGDGCCDDYGTKVYVNGFQVAADADNSESVAMALMAFLNIDDVSVEWDYDE
jgi:hypothetical protein